MNAANEPATVASPAAISAVNSDFVICGKKGLFNRNTSDWDKYENKSVAEPKFYANHRIILTWPRNMFAADAVDSTAAVPIIICTCRNS